MKNTSPYSAALTACGLQFNEFNRMLPQLLSLDRKANIDRKIVADNGWTIILGRGLDIFEPYPKFTMSCAAQENRRCRAFSVTYTNDL